MSQSMQEFRCQSRIDATPEEVYGWHTREGAFRRLVAPWTDVKLIRTEGICDGCRAHLLVGPEPLAVNWIAQHRNVVDGRQFGDVQVEGPFSRWEHLHRMDPAGDGCLLSDHIQYELPFGSLGNLGSGLMQRQLEKMFAYRHRITKADVEIHRKYGWEPHLRVAITGASGLIGSALSAFLTAGGHEVLRLVRSNPKTKDEVYWSPSANKIDADRLEGLDAVVHLAGENAFSLRWTEAKKGRILESRVKGTGLIARTLARLKQPPEVLISASAIGYYGDRGEDRLTEESAAASDGFMAGVCKTWEQAAEPAMDAGIRTVLLRTGLVLSAGGGMLGLMLPAFRLGLGGYITGKHQYASWIALDDVLYAIYHAMRTDLSTGPINLTAPHPVLMEEFTETLAGVLHRPAFFPVPASLVEAAMGEVARETVLASARVVPERLERSGFTFHYPRLEGALKHLLGAGA